MTFGDFLLLTLHINEIFVCSKPLLHYKKQENMRQKLEIILFLGK